MVDGANTPVKQRLKEGDSNKLNICVFVLVEFSFSLVSQCPDALAKFRHHLVIVRNISWFDLKYLFRSPQSHVQMV